MDDYRFVGGLDIAHSQKSNVAVVFLKIYEWSAFGDVVGRRVPKAVYTASCEIEVDIPYSKESFVFRELPGYIRVLEIVRKQKPNMFPDLLLIEGHDAGSQIVKTQSIPWYLGQLYMIPTIGINNQLVDVDNVVDYDICEKRGDTFNIVTNTGITIGSAIKSSNNKGEMGYNYIYCGYKITLEEAIQVTQKMNLRRMIEPIRLADEAGRARLKVLEMAT